jgi:hypothetical protein
LEVGGVEGALSRSVVAAVGTSTGMLLTFLLVPRLRNFLGLANPNLLGWGLVGGSAVTAVALSRIIQFGWDPDVLWPDWTRQLRHLLIPSVVTRAGRPLLALLPDQA